LVDNILSIDEIYENKEILFNTDTKIFIDEEDEAEDEDENDNH
jgi:hypothetical protein